MLLDACCSQSSMSIASWGEIPFQWSKKWPLTCIRFNVVPVDRRLFMYSKLTSKSPDEPFWLGLYLWVESFASMTFHVILLSVVLHGTLLVPFANVRCSPVVIGEVHVRLIKLLHRWLENETSYQNQCRSILCSCCCCICIQVRDVHCTVPCYSISMPPIKQPKRFRF